MLKKLDDRCPVLFSPWLTGGMSMWPRSANDSSSGFVARGLRCRCMIWFAANENAGAGLLRLELLLLVCCKAGWLLGRRLMVSAKGRSEEIRSDTSKDFLKLALKKS